MMQERPVPRDPIAAAAWMDALYQRTSSGVVLLAGGAVIAANPAALRILDAEQHPVIEQPWAAVCRLTRADGSDLPEEEDPILLAARGRQPYRVATLGLCGHDGERRLLQVEAIPVLDEEGAPIQVVCTLVEGGAQRGPGRDEEGEILYDPLTGLVNRALFRDRLQHALACAQRSSGPLTLMILALARFGEVTGAGGRPAGDLLLQEVGDRLRRTLRDSDTVGRLGSDRFAVLLPDTDPAGAVHVMRRILRAVQQPYLLQGQRIEVGAGIGIALYPEHGKDADTLLDAAEMARQEAARGGRDHAIYAAEQAQYSAARLALTGELHQAIGRGQLLLQYQPRVAMQTGVVWGLEAELRWEHPQRGPIPADQFIPIAEQSGLIDALTWWTLETALRQRQAWPRAAQELFLAITLSLRTLHDSHLPKSIGDLLQQYGVPVAMLTLEVSRGSLIADSARNVAMLTRLAETGIHLTINNFGAEFTPLAYLRRLPIQAVTIDRSLVQGMGAGTMETERVRTIIESCHGLGLGVVAEGVESQRVWDLLMHLHCDYAQGQHISEPLTTADLERWPATMPRSVLCP